MRDKDNAIICRMTMSKWRPNQSVPTYFVSSKPRKGCFTQINDAIQYAQPYSRIELLSGLFTEAVVVNKAIEIGSEKGDEQAVIAYHLAAMVLQTKEAYIEGVTIKNTETQAAMRIDKGSPIVARCEVGGIEICGDATPLVEECKIEASPVHGLSVLQTAGGMYKGNSIIASGWYGIHVESTGPVTFMHNSVTEGAQGQIIIQGNSDVNPVFQYNRIIDQVKTSIDPSLLHQTQAYKLEHLPVKTAGQTVIVMPIEMTTSVRAAINEENVDDAVVNTVDLRCAVDISGGAHPSFTRNTVVGSMNNGFFIHGGAHGNYEHNYVTSNRGWAMVVDGPTTKAHIVANSINGNGGGIKVVNSPTVCDGKNEFVENRGPQLMLVNGHDEFRFTHNELRSGTKIAVLCKDGGTGLIENNSFDQCGTAIRTEYGANPLVRDNSCGMTNIGVCALRGGRGEFIDNEFGNLSVMCVLISTGGNPTFTNCRFLTSNGGVLVTKGGKGSFRRCIMKDNKSAQIEICDRGDPEIFDCFIADGREDGVKVHARGKGTLHRNLIAGNERSQIWIRTQGDPIVDSNVITRSHCDGILVEDGGLGTIVNNVIERCRLCGISVVAQAMPTVRANVITLCREAGLHIGEEAGGGVYEKNEIFGNRRTNVHICGSGVISTTTQREDDVNTNNSRQQPTSLSASGGGEAASSDPTGGGAIVDQNQRHNLNYSVVLLRSNKIYDALGFGLMATSRCEAVIADNLFQENAGGAVRIATGADVILLRNEFVAGSDGVVAVEDSKARVLGNSFSDLKGAAITVDEGTKSLIQWNTLEHCINGIVMKNSTGWCFLNVVLQSTVSGIVMGPHCRCFVRHNALFENEVSVRIDGRARGSLTANVLFESEGSGLHIEGDDIHTLIDANVILNCKQSGLAVRRGAPKIGLTLIMNSVLGVDVSGEHAAPLMHNVYVSCCHKGVLWDAQSRGKMEQSLIGHCDVGVHFQQCGAATVKGSVVHNCNAVGVLGSDGAFGEVSESILFKNFFNACFTTEAKTSVVASLVQAAVSFSIVCTKQSTPVVTRSVIASRVLGTDEDLDEAKEADRQSTVIYANLKKMFGETVIRAAWRPYEFLIRSLWDDLYATNTITVGGLPAEWVPPPDTVSESGGADDLGGGVVDAGDALRSRTASVFSSLSHNNSRPLSAMSSVSLRSGGVGGDNSEAADGSAHGTSANNDTVLSSGEGSGGGGAARQAHIVTVADILRSKTIPVPRRTAILFPSNMNDTPDEYIGPGGPFALHRLLGGDTNAYLKGMFTYYSTGIRVDDGASPTLEGCVIRDHRYREMKLLSKRLPPAALASKTSGPNLRAMLNEKAASDVAKKLRQVRANSLLKAAGPFPPQPLGGGTSRNPRKNAGRHRTSVKRREVEIQSTDETDGSPGAPSAENGASHSKTIELFGAPFSLDRDAFIDRLLLVASPCFYQHPAAPHPMEVLPELFTMPSSSEPRAADDDGKQLLKNQNATKFLVGLGAADHLRDQEQSFIPTASTADFTGFGAIFCSGATGTVSRCQFLRNQTGLMIETGANPTISISLVAHQQGDGVWIRAAGLGTLRGNKVTKNKLSQVRVEGDGTHPSLQENEFFDALSPGVVVSGVGARGEIVSNRFSNLTTSGGVVVEREASPRIHNNEIMECTHGLLFRLGGNGCATKNQISGCLKNGVLVEGGHETEAQPTIEGNTIVESRECGITVIGDGTKPSIVHNQIARHGHHGVALLNGAAGDFVSNDVFANEEHGFLVSHGASGLIDGNTISKNLGHGIYVSAGGAPFAQHNRIVSGSQFGIALVDGGGTFSLNRILRHSIGGGVSVGGSGSTAALFEQNEIDDCALGAQFETACSPEFYNNVVTRSQVGGIVVEGRLTQPHMKGNYLKSNQNFAVKFHLSGSGRLEETVILATQGNGVEIRSGGNPTLNSCIVSMSSENGVMIGSGGVGTVSECIVTGAEKSGVQLSDSNGQFRLKNCLVADCGESAVVAEKSAAGALMHNTFLGRFRQASVMLQPTTALSVDGNFFVDQKIAAANYGSSTFIDCLFNSCVTGLLDSSESGGGSAVACEFRECQTGVLCVKGGSSVSACQFVGITRSGVTVLNDSTPTIEKSSFQRCRVAINLESGSGIVDSNEIFNCADGMFISSDAEVKSNQIYDCNNAGITVRDGRPTITNNLVYDNYGSGVVLDKGAGVLEDNKLFFAREDGALEVKPTSTTVQNRNTIKNSFSPPKEKSYAERQALYKRQEQEKEKSSMGFRKLAKILDSMCSELFVTLLEHKPRICDAVAPTDIEWLFAESRDEKPVSAVEEAAPSIPEAAARRPTDPFAPPSHAAHTDYSDVDVRFIASTTERIVLLLDSVRPAKLEAVSTTPTTTSLPAAPAKPKGSRASGARRQSQSKKSNET